MQEYFDGKVGTWDPAKDIVAWDKLKRILVDEEASPSSPIESKVLMSMCHWMRWNLVLMTWFMLNDLVSSLALLYEQWCYASCVRRQIVIPNVTKILCILYIYAFSSVCFILKWGFIIVLSLSKYDFN